MKKPKKEKIKKVDILPAAVNSFPLNEFVAVRYRLPKGKKPFTAEKVNGIRTVYLPDRTIYIGRGNSITIGLLSVEPDQFLFTSPLSNPESLKDLGYNYMMVTPERLSSSEYVRRNGIVKLFSDSGGFQLSKGVTEFIEPEMVAAFYKKKIDYGIGLDVPLPLHLQHTEWFSRMARVTVANNKFIARELKGTPAELYDVSHGLTLENRKTFTKIVLDNQAGTGLALGGIGQANYDTLHRSTLMAVLNLCYVLDAAKGQYEKFHVLGTTAPFMISVYNLLTKLDVAPKITADSSSYAQGALAFSTRGVQYSAQVKTAMFPLENRPVAYGLPCNCPMCSMVGYPQVYRLSQSGNAYHNLFALQRQYQIIDDYTTAYLNSTKVESDLINTFGTPETIHPLYRALFKFILDMPKGFDYAYKKHYESFRSSFRKDFQETVGLFKSRVTIPAALLKAEENTTKAIIRYEEFHGIGKTKKKAKK